MKGFLEFIRSQKVAGLAIAFILSAEVSKVVQSIVNDLLNPLLGIFIGFTGSLSEAYISIGQAQIKWGNFVNALINFLIMASIVYLLMRTLRLEPKGSKK